MKQSFKRHFLFRKHHTLIELLAIINPADPPLRVVNDES